MKYISLSKGLFTLVDDADFEWLNQWKWYARHDGRDLFYAARNIPANDGKQKTVRMHQVIMRTPPNMHTDHINGNGLDNRRANLRVCTPSQNIHNQRVSSHCASGYKGVHFMAGSDLWRVRIRTIRGPQVTVGYFKDKIEAAKAYNKKAVELYGEYARLNDV